MIFSSFGLIVSGCSSAADDPLATVDVAKGGANGDGAVENIPAPPVASNAVSLKYLGRYRHGERKKSTAEICAFDTGSKRLFVVDGERAAIDILDITNPAEPQLFKSVDLTEYGSKPNSITAKGGVIAAAVAADPKQEPGLVVFLSPGGKVLKTVHVGAEPDMLTISPDGHWLLTAN
ncbi:MAG TPA: alkaline phosphatase, partial [Planctomycetaceae bacterium]|nr:alkaline phosphatase [Planctomycetaceae bacterium]